MTELISNMPRLSYLGCYMGLGAAALYALVYGLQKCLHLVEQLSVNVADINKRLDALAETTRHDFATQWQQQFQSTLSDQQNELETCIKVQAERLAAQSKQISLMRDKTNTVVTQNDDIQTYQQELIDLLLEKQTQQQELIESLQRQHENLREKTEETFRAQAAQFNRRFAFQQELRGEYDKLAKLTQILWICFVTNHQTQQGLAQTALHLFTSDDYNNYYESMTSFRSYITHIPQHELRLTQFIESIKNLC